MDATGGSHLRGGVALERLLAMLAVGGLAASVLLDLPVRRSAFAGSDLKTLYAAAWCLRHGLDGYSFANLAAVFRAQGVVAPASWYGHAPVYPPATLALLGPLTALPMVAAVYAGIVLSAGVFAWAVAALSRYARESFALPAAACAVLMALCAAGPLLGFALSMGNLSVATSALGIVAFVRRRRAAVWGCALPLGLALLLKPHLAVWMAVGMLLLPETRSRRIAAAALAGAAVVVLLVGLGAWWGGDLLREMRAFGQILSAETAPGGSMNLRSREVLPVLAQITSFRSLLGVWIPRSGWLLSAAVPLLGAGAVLLTLGTRRVRTEAEASLAVGAWCAFGLLLTYHRAHDALVLLVLLPWLLDCLRRRPGDWLAWGVPVLYVALSVGPDVGGIARVVAAGHPPSSFFALRQAALAAGLLFLALLALLLRRGDRLANHQDG